MGLLDKSTSYIPRNPRSDKDASQLTEGLVLPSIPEKSHSRSVGSLRKWKESSVNRSKRSQSKSGRSRSKSGRSRSKSGRSRSSLPSRRSHTTSVSKFVLASVVPPSVSGKSRSRSEFVVPPSVSGKSGSRSEFRSMLSSKQSKSGTKFWEPVSRSGMVASRSSQDGYEEDFDDAVSSKYSTSTIILMLIAFAALVLCAWYGYSTWKLDQEFELAEAKEIEATKSITPWYSNGKVWSGLVLTTVLLGGPLAYYFLAGGEQSSPLKSTTTFEKVVEEPIQQDPPSDGEEPHVDEPLDYGECFTQERHENICKNNPDLKPGYTYWLRKDCEVHLDEVSRARKNAEIVREEGYEGPSEEFDFLQQLREEKPVSWGEATEHVC